MGASRTRYKYVHNKSATLQQVDDSNRKKRRLAQVWKARPAIRLVAFDPLARAIRVVQ